MIISPDTRHPDFKEAIAAFSRSHGYMPQAPRAALIDMDGTLYDSMPRHARAWTRLFSDLGIPVDPNEFFVYEGMTGAAIIDLIYKRHLGHGVSADEAARLYAVKAGYFGQEGRAGVMPGAPGVVQTLRDNNIDTVLVTGSGQASILDLVNSDYTGAFPEGKRVTSHDVTHGKPHPEPYLRGLALAGCAAASAIALENAPLGVQSANAAGIFTIAVNTGPIDIDRLDQSGAAVTFASMQQCADLLQQLLYTLNNTSQH